MFEFRFSPVSFSPPAWHLACTLSSTTQPTKGKTVHRRRTAPALCALSLASCSGETILGPADGSGEDTFSSYEVVHFRNHRVDRVDLLLVVDNSPSMADKQRLLAHVVPELVRDLANPVCVDRHSGNPVGTVGTSEACGEHYPGTERAFEPVQDLHVGVITTSLGGFGADSCSPVPGGFWNPAQEDMAHLITRGIDEEGKSEQVSTDRGLGFLKWDPSGWGNPSGESDLDRLQTDFANLVRGAGQDGCGFEASLEAWYRFLVDPTPYERMVPVPCQPGDTEKGCRGPEGVDEVVLQQREDFLRADSAVVIVMLSDENDCSLATDPQSFLALQRYTAGGADFHVARGTDACASDPWDSDCKSCWEVDPAEYPECAAGWPNPGLDDPLNLRCFNQKRRFGADFLHPIRRYVDALTDSSLPDGTLSPLFCGAFRDASRTECATVSRGAHMVHLVGVVGVPWQDIAIDLGDLSAGFLPPERLSWTPDLFAPGHEPPGLPEGKTLWDVILGEVDENPGDDVDGDGWISTAERNPRYGTPLPTAEPLDPLMRESVDPRTGVHPATGAALVAPSENDPLAHPVNGSERTIPGRSDLQYACVFDLGELGAIDCSLPANAVACDCVDAPDNPLCWDGEAYGTTQLRGKAYPARRQLAVLKGLGTQGIVTSICPANTRDPGSLDFGYRPAMRAISNRLAPLLSGTCGGVELDIGSDGQVDCVVLETSRGASSGDEITCPPCESARSEPTVDLWRALRGEVIFTENGMQCACVLHQAEPGPELEACVQRLDGPFEDAWCYVDADQDPSHNPELTSGCPSGWRRKIRFVGNAPAEGALTFLACKKRG